MNLIEKLNLITEQAKGKLKPDLKKYGKNFRAISESAVLEVLNPLFKEYNITYEPIIEKSALRVEKINCGRDAAGNLIQRLVFVAEVVVSLRFISTNKEEGITIENKMEETLEFYGYGSGVDSGDKATGKAYTAAVKYALFKGLRLQYSDDPDAEASEDIEDIIEENNSSKEVIEELKPKKSDKKGEKEPLATEKQLDYVRGLAVSLNLSDERFLEKFGVSPVDSKMTMRKAREIIEELKKMVEEDLPF